MAEGHEGQGTGRLLACGLLLMAVYQLPEGLGLRRSGSLAVVAALWACFYGVAWGVGRFLGQPRFRAFALGSAPGFGPRFGLLLGAALVAKALALGLGASLGVYRVQGPSALPAGWLGALGMGALTTFIPSVAEDLVTRGYPWRRVPAAWGTAGFLGVSTLVFVLNHVYRLGKGPLEWAFLAVLGLTYATALAREGTLWAAVALHWGWNLANAWADLAGEVTVLRPAAAPWVSMGAHLLLLALVVSLPRIRGAADPVQG
jgi:membrane protease YdiL (CAAX protease family)